MAVLAPELARLRAERIAGVPLGIIHGDLFVDNVLYDDAGALTALIDFEQASWGRFAYDLAVTTLAFGYGRDDFRPEIVRALIEAYARPRAPVTDAERAAFGAELRFVACRFAVTRITDVHLKRDAGAAPGQELPALPGSPRQREDSTWRRATRCLTSSPVGACASGGARYLRTMLMYLRRVSLRSSSRST